MDKPLAIANWKMHKGLAQARQWVKGLSGHRATRRCETVLCPPAIWIEALAKSREASIAFGGQDCHARREGPHTGDISARMLREAGCDFVLIGHSERRRDHGEEDQDIRSKLRAAIEEGLTPILCVGENADQRAAGSTDDVLRRQLSILPDLGENRLIIAYEPIWAIGAGRPAKNAEIVQAHRWIRSKARGNVQVVYGGSVSPSSTMFDHPQVDGVLVGGASLEERDFLAILERMG